MTIIVLHEYVPVFQLPLAQPSPDLPLTGLYDIHNLVVSHGIFTGNPFFRSIFNFCSANSNARHASQVDSSKPGPSSL